MSSCRLRVTPPTGLQESSKNESKKWKRMFALNVSAKKKAAWWHERARGAWREKKKEG